MKVSILVPIYGVEKYIERCAVSLFEQTYEDIEYIFVNDCTKDNSISILKEVIERYPARKPQVRIIEHEQNKGLGGARNTAVAAATGEFLMHVDSDDYIDVTCVEKCVKKQEETGADIICVNAYQQFAKYTVPMLNGSFSSSKDHCLALLKRKTQVNVWGKLIRTDLYNKNNISVEEGINMGEDYQVTGRLMYYAAKTAVVDEFLYFYDCSNEGSYSNQFSKEKHRQSWRSFDIVKEFFSDRGQEYVDALGCAEISIITSHLIMSGKIDNGSYYYKEARRRLKLLDKKYWSNEPRARQLVLILSACYPLMKSYTQLSRYLTHTAKSINS